MGFIVGIIILVVVILLLRKVLKYGDTPVDEEESRRESEIDKAREKEETLHWGTFAEITKRFNLQEIRERADQIIEGKIQVGWLEPLNLAIALTAKGAKEDDPEQEKDVERISKLSKIQENLHKKSEKATVTCPQCGRSLKGATRAMIGDVGVCPKCKTEFVIEQKDVKLIDEQKQ